MNTPKDARRAVRVYTRPVSGLTSRPGIAGLCRSAFPRSVEQEFAGSQWLRFADAMRGLRFNSITVAGAASD